MVPPSASCRYEAGRGAACVQPAMHLPSCLLLMTCTLSSNCMPMTCMDGAISQVGQATCASPAGRYLLYLETPAMPGQTAAQQLSPAVAALTRRGQADAAAADAQGAAQSAAAPLSAASAGVPHSAVEASLAAASAKGHALSTQDGVMDVRPKLLMAAFYVQSLTSPSEVCSSSMHPPADMSNVLSVAPWAAMADMHADRDATPESGAGSPAKQRGMLQRS